MARRPSTVAVVWRGARDERPEATRNFARLTPVFDALAASGVAPEPVLYRDEIAGEVRERLRAVRGVLVWVDPIGGDETRAVLDGVLRDVAASGVWIGAHPDTILKMATKEVVHRTRSLGWGTDTRLYGTVDELHRGLPASLRAGLPRVLKQNRGNGGIGVWKVELVEPGAPAPTTDALVRVQHAAPRDDTTEDLTLGAFMTRCEQYLAGGGKLLDQAFVARLADGMVRAYLVQDAVVGFASQQPAAPTAGNDAPAPGAVLGMPAAKTMYGADEPRFASLRRDLERDWVPGLRALAGVDEAALPLLWDADFLYGPRDDRGADTYVLCEINASSVLPFPDAAPARLAAAVARRM